MTEALGLIEVIGYPPAIEAADAALKAANVKLGAITRVDGGILTVQILGDVGAVKAAVDAGSSSAARVGTVRAAHVIPRLDSSLISFMTVPGKGMRHLGRTGRQVSQTPIVSSQKVKENSMSSKEEEHIPVVDPGIDRLPLLDVDMNEVSQEGAYIAKDIEEGIDEESEDFVAADTVSDEGTNLAEEEKEVKPQVQEEGAKPNLTELSKLSTKELKNLIASLGIKVAAKKIKSAKKDELIHMITQFYKEGEN